MNEMRRGVLSLLVTMGAFCLLSWPLPRYLAQGFPASAFNMEQENARAMIPGDHLQFLYHFWLAKDVMTGSTPLFFNLYEFNTGSDEARRARTTYYLPFSLFFALWALAGTNALGWNMAMLMAMWIGYWFSWKLVNRYQSDEWVSAMLALFALILPYPWIVLMGGSPTGFSMMWVPMVVYGMDRWIGDRSWEGAALAGFSVYFSGWSDPHVFFFSALLAPCWGLLVCVHRGGLTWPGRSDWSSWMRAAWPLLVFAALVIIKAMGVQRGLQDTAIAAGRSLQEVDLFSIGIRNLYRVEDDGRIEKIYLGGYALALLGAVAAYVVIGVFRRRASGRLMALLLVLAGTALALLLSSGPRNPLGPPLWRLVTTLIPPYGMIRQPDKIFCLMPLLIMMAAALAIPAIQGRFSQNRLRMGVFLVMLPLVIEYSLRLNPAICLLDQKQDAYLAVVSDAASRDMVPLAMALPLWPGDSHYSSVYQYYASLYRLRMINGYRPTARQAYVDGVFEPYNSLALGDPSGEQLDGLQSMGINYLILHEDVFPEKVSSFPVGVTLANLLKHTRLELLKRDGPAWAFRILNKPEPRNGPDMPVYFPVRLWNWESNDCVEGLAVEDESAMGGRYLRLSGNMMEPVMARRVRLAGDDAMEWHIRVKGAGSFDVHMQAEGEGPVVYSTNIHAESWQWMPVKAPPSRGLVHHEAGVRVVSGTVDLDGVLLTRSGWRSPPSGSTVSIPAACFFHAGYTSDDLSSVMLRQDHDPARMIFYSRNLYMEPGRYAARLVYASGAEQGTCLGRISMDCGGGRGAQAVASDVLAGEEASLEFDHPESTPFRFGFTYARLADMLIERVELVRLP